MSLNDSTMLRNAPLGNLVIVWMSQSILTQTKMNKILKGTICYSPKSTSLFQWHRNSGEHLGRGTGPFMSSYYFLLYLLICLKALGLSLCQITKTFMISTLQHYSECYPILKSLETQHLTWPLYGWKCFQGSPSRKERFIHTEDLHWHVTSLEFKKFFSCLHISTQTQHSLLM